jgi:hypothetical protein
MTLSVTVFVCSTEMVRIDEIASRSWAAVRDSRSDLAAKTRSSSSVGLRTVGDVRFGMCNPFSLESRNCRFVFDARKGKGRKKGGGQNGKIENRF